MLLVAEADRLDRDANDRDRGGNGPEAEHADLTRDLEDRATDYERRADAGGDDTTTPEELRELATDARSQAQLYRDMDEATQSTRSQEAPAREAQANRAEAGVVYDSAERRRDNANQMESAGVDKGDARVRMRVDADQGIPAAEAVAPGAHPGTRNVRGPQARGPQRTDRATLTPHHRALTAA